MEYVSPRAQTSCFVLFVTLIVIGQFLSEEICDQSQNASFCVRIPDSKFVPGSVSARGKMPVKIDPPPPANSVQPGVTTSLLYNGSRFQGHQKSKGNCYDVEVVLQVRNIHAYSGAGSTRHITDSARTISAHSYISIHLCVSF